MNVDNGYHKNHYVPIWYQKRFVENPGTDHKLWYLDLDPPKVFDSKGQMHTKSAMRRVGFKSAFVQEDLYTTEFRGITSTDIEQRFFGSLDSNGHKAVDYFSRFAYPWDGTHLSNEMVLYMSTQKLRTPKGLAWLHSRVGARDRNHLLVQMMRYRQLHCALWSECVWLIAEASDSDTKFIISDHPVTVYNRACGPQACKRNGDPDIWLNGTHTIFPLSLNKVLILTNLSWVRNPYQSAKTLRPHPDPFHSTIFKVTDIQTLRKLNEEEVRQINFIIKSQSHQYVAAAKEDWLYPERFISKSDWYNYGNGYLLMPDPRSVTYGGQILIGHRDGTSSAFDEYGRRPWQDGFKGFEKSGVDEDWNTFQRFNGEFARLYGPYRRGRAFNAMHLDNEMDDEEFHKYHLKLEDEYKAIMKKRRKN